MRLLPSHLERDLGFTPYVWLVYAVPFVLDPFWRHRPLAEQAVTLAATLVFLVLYFAGYWRKGRPLLPIVGGILALGVAFAPVNGGALAFFIYAAAHAAWVGSPRVAARVIGAIVAVAGVESYLLELPPYFAFVAIFFSLMIGGVNIHFAEVARKNVKLRQAQEEIEQMAKIAERERIARDLHDLLGHTLSVIVLKSELASKLAARGDSDAAVREIRDVERISREALHHVREAVTGYRGSVAAELKRAQQALEAAGMRFEPQVEEGALEPAQEGVLALAIREAVTNVVRHSGARSCRLRLARDAGRARLVIEDDGQGGLAPEGVGLSSMRERVAALGGTLERVSENGTRLEIQVPRAAAP